MISGPMRGLEKNALEGTNIQTDTQTNGHGDSMTNSAQWGRVGENLQNNHYMEVAHKVATQAIQNIQQNQTLLQTTALKTKSLSLLTNLPH